MKRYVSLASDENPHYAIYAPIVARLWRRLGYEPLIFLHCHGWGSPFAQFVRSQLEGFITIETPRVDPLSIGNTMRCVRLVGSTVPGVEPDDLVITADIDMAPLSRTFWERDSWDAFILRADLYGPIRGTSGLLHDGSIALICGLFRFPLCYVGLRASIWRSILPIVAGDPHGSLRRLMHGLRSDVIDYDEQLCSARLLLWPGAVGALEYIEGGPQTDTWKQGELNVVAASHWPTGCPHGMLIHGGAKKKPADAIDFHMPRPSAPWVGEILAHYWPEEAEFIRTYWAHVTTLTEVRD